MKKKYEKPVIYNSANEMFEDVFAACCGPDCCGPVYNASGIQTGWKVCKDPACDETPFCGKR